MAIYLPKSMTAPRPRLAFIVVALCLTAFCRAHSANIIANGSFETPDVSGSGFITVLAGQNTIVPWQVTMGSIDLLNDNNVAIVGPAFDGSQYIDLNGTDAGQIQQTFPTTPGQVYTLSFAYADNYFSSPLPRSAEVRVFDMSGDLLLQTVVHTGSMAGNLNWLVFSAPFAATDAMATLEFTSLDSGSPSGLLLDAVSVDAAAAIPETSTVVTAALAFGAVAGHFSFRRRARSALKS